MKDFFAIKTNTCVGCNRVYTVMNIDELNETSYCSKDCEEAHSIFNQPEPVEGV